MPSEMYFNPADVTMNGVTLPIVFDVASDKTVFHPPDRMACPIVRVQIEMAAFEGDDVPCDTE